MDFEAFFTTELQSLHSEGRYRVFADIERQQGNFPRATRYNANGERKDFVMSKLAPTLSMEDRVNIAIYFGQQQLLAHTEPVDEALRQQGEATFKTVCTGCHGVNAEGREDTPRLAGQPGEYVRKALTRFRDKDPSRAGSVMMAIAANFSDAQISSLAAYLQTLR